LCMWCISQDERALGCLSTSTDVSVFDYDGWGKAAWRFASRRSPEPGE